MRNEIEILENIDYIIEKFGLNLNKVSEENIEENNIQNINTNEIAELDDSIEIERETKQENDDIVNYYYE